MTLADMPELREVHLKGTKVTREGVKELECAVPDLLVADFGSRVDKHLPFNLDGQ